MPFDALRPEDIERAARIQRDRRASVAPIWDPTVREEFSFDNEDDSLIVKRIQDCSPFLERAHQIREHGNWRGEDNDFWHYASVPNEVCHQLLQRGINIFRDEDLPKVLAYINTEAPYLKCTPKFIWK